MIESNIETQKKIWGDDTLQELREPEFQRHVRNHLRSIFKSLPQEKWLDLGGYRGDLSEELDAVVQDLNVTALTEANGRGLSGVVGDIHFLPYKDNHFDAVLMSHVLEHAADTVVVLNELKRIMKPGGNLVVIVPNAAGFGQLLKLVTKGDVKPAGNPPWALPEHLHHFSKKNGVQFFKEQDWLVEKVMGDCFHVPLRRTFKLNRLPIMMAKLLPSWSESLIFILKKPEK